MEAVKSCYYNITMEEKATEKCLVCRRDIDAKISLLFCGKCLRIVIRMERIKLAKSCSKNLKKLSSKSMGWPIVRYTDWQHL
jgi:hypothetical protein